jgi:RNA polymerase sigma-70 factor (ECF subfamily)
VINVTDEDIMMKAKDGNTQMLAILFERHHVKLFNFFLRLTGDRGASEDLTQEVFVRILKYRNTYRGESKFTTWMFQIGRNAHIDHFRKHKKDMPLDEVWDEKHTPEPSPESQSEKDQDEAFLHKALANLSPTKKEVIMLSRFQGLKYQDISEILGCSISSVKVQVHRAIKDLRKNYLQLRGGFG